jgi:hypothetical protein
LKIPWAWARPFLLCSHFIVGADQRESGQDGRFGERKSPSSDGPDEFANSIRYALKPGFDAPEKNSEAILLQLIVNFVKGDVLV